MPVRLSFLDIVQCPACGAALRLAGAPPADPSQSIERGELLCAQGHSYSIENHIPRFVSSDKYVGNFSFEWNRFRTVQLDIFNGTTESEDTFQDSTGWTPDALKGKLVLDVGIGSGRFSEVASRWGATVVGIDLSTAVDAAYLNIGERPNVQIVQADIFSLPFKPEVFDAIFSIGVLHHTPDTRQAFDSLVPLLKPGGEIAVWLYAEYFRLSQFPSDMIRKFTAHMPERLVYYLSWLPVPLYHLPRFLRVPLFKFFMFSLHPNAEWRWLDTFDWYSPKFAWKHSYPEVFQWCRDRGLKDIYIPPRLLALRAAKP